MAQNITPKKSLFLCIKRLRFLPTNTRNTAADKEFRNDSYKFKVFMEKY